MLSTLHWLLIAIRHEFVDQNASLSILLELIGRSIWTFDISCLHCLDRLGSPDQFKRQTRQTIDDGWLFTQIITYPLPRRLPDVWLYKNGLEAYPYAGHLQVELQHMLSTSDIHVDVEGRPGDQVQSLPQAVEVQIGGCCRCAIRLDHSHGWN